MPGDNELQLEGASLAATNPRPPNRRSTGPLPPFVHATLTPVTGASGTAWEYSGRGGVC